MLSLPPPSQKRGRWDKALHVCIAQKTFLGQDVMRELQKWHWPICNVTDCNGEIMSGIYGTSSFSNVCEYNFLKPSLPREIAMGINSYSGVFPRKIEIFAYLDSVKKIFGILSGFYMAWSVLHYITFPLQMLTINVKHVKNLCYGMP